MPGTAPELAIPATAPGESAPLAAKPLDPVAPPTAVAPNPVTIAARRESVVLQGAKEKKEVAALKQFVNDDRHFSLVRNFRLADVVTLMNGFCGALSVFSSAHYLLTSCPSHLWRALAFPLAGMFFDFLDGRVARWRNESSMLGQELDSLADSLSFGVAPAVLAFALGMRTVPDIMLLSGFVCCGIARLARFNATVAFDPKDKAGKSKYFEGLPIPSTLVLVAFMAECARRRWIEETPHPLLPDVGGGLNGEGLPWGLVEPLRQYGVEVHWVSGLFVMWGVMMVSKTLKVPKP